MDWSFLFFLVSVLFGLGLGAGVFSAAVQAVRGEQHFEGWKVWISALLFAAFQFGMALAGYGISRSLAGSSGLEGSLIWAAILLSLYFGGKMILEGLRALRRGEPSLEREIRASEDPLSGNEEHVERPKMTAEDAVPGRPVTRTRVGDKIPVMWRVFLKAFGASGAAFAAGFAIPKLPFKGALAEGGIIFLCTFIFALTGLFRDQKKEMKAAWMLEIAGGVLVILAAALSLVRHFSA